MKLSFLRGACVVLETDDARIMCDPWLMDGCYYGAWAHYPPFTDKDWDRKELRNIDLVYVSHIHPDHFDLPTMRRLKTIWEGNLPPVVIYDYPPALKVLRNQIQELGFEVIELKHGVPFEFGWLKASSIRIFSADGCDPQACGSFYGCAMPGVTNTQIDSLAVIQDPHHTVVNVNDCPFALSRRLCEQIALEYPSIDLAMIAYAGAAPFPQCFAMTSAMKRHHAQVRRVEFIENVIRFAKTLRAKRVFPFAGDYQLCGPLADLNEYRGVPDIMQVHETLMARGIDTAHLAPGWTIPDIGARLTFPIIDNEDDRRQYVKTDLAARKLDYADDSLPNDIDELWPAAFERFDAKRKEYGLQCTTTAYVDNGHGYYEIPPVGKWRDVDKIDRHNPHVAISTDPRLLSRLLRGPKHAHWNNAQIGSHIMFDRKPLSLYETGLYHLLSYLHA